jgi:protein-S-isoprenylcysteine O-methyltransferase Ste14
MTPELAITVIWLLWVASWLAAAIWSDPAAKRPAHGEQRLYRTATFAGAILLFGSGYFYRSRYALWDLGWGANWALVAVAVFGLMFTWWARLYLGRLWSSSVTKKADHRVVDTGPYAIVRHPIYTGIIAAIFATAAVMGTLIGVAGALLMALGFWIKARLEERFLCAQLGSHAYDSYRRRVPMLIPFGPTSA